mmetsp:Transcript_16460/g.34332  ORF Transcript_16460/g.34332 Transcript_16460/m.34332 type:complete len:83 (-) Transcript_16460:275-523(-)
MTLECFPALRGIGISETAAEFAELKAREEVNATKRTSSRRRTTRTQSLARGGRAASFYRHHYFDKILTTLRWEDEVPIFLFI